MTTLTPLFTFAISRRSDSQAPPPGAGAVPGVSQARQMGEQFLLSHLVPPPDGVGLHFRAPMKGRVLETALVLHILQKNSLDADWQIELETYLMDQVYNTDNFSRSVAMSVLAMSTRGSALGASSFGLNRLLGSLEYAKKRKHALFGLILEEVGVMPPQSLTANPARFADEAVHLFSRLYMTSMSLMRRKWQPDGLERRDDLAFLADAQGKNGGWEQQALITILAIMALGPAHPSFVGALRFLKSLTREDGGVAFTDNLNLWTTALVALALQRSKAVPKAVFHRIADYIVSRQHENGGWAFSEDVKQPDTDTSSQCVQLLIQLDPELYAAPIERAQDYFLRLHRPDGGYPTYERAGDSEVTMSANIALVQSLWIERRPELRGPIQQALRFIRSRQKADGTFERSWSLCETYSVFRVNLALNGCRGVDDDLTASGEVQDKSLHYLLDNQYDDGGWGQTTKMRSDVLSTSYGLLSLALLRRKVPRENLELAQKFLVGRQSVETGELASIPDVVGPRPIVFDIPLLSTSFATMALSVVEQI